ncbi:MAG: sulfatase [Bacteroidetes bacterium]|nr:sulfatase [Bacteroidota bacterium]
MKVKKIAGLVVVALLAAFPFSCSEKATEQKPNIVWIMMEDWGYQLSCYGEPGVQTPNIDKFAEQGIRFTSSFCTAPVCSPSRSAMMTGFHQNYVGGNQHRTKEPDYEKQPLPYGIKPITHLLEEAGYFTCFMASRKTDLNYTLDRPVFQGKDWSERAEGQPFYAQLTFGGTHRKWNRDPENPISIDKVQLPPYYPQSDLAKRDWANGLESAQLVDKQIGEVLQRLADEGIAENTLVFIIGDNGRCMPRGKQFLYDGGIQVPIMVSWPGKIKSGQVNDNMVTTIDISKTILDAAGITPPHPLQGKNLLDESTDNRKYIFAARDKMDETHDAMRAIRSKEFKLIHNLMPERAYCQFNRYKETSYPVLAELNVLNMKGEMPPEQAAFMAATKPEFELYDMINDPYELNNLADNSDYKKLKEELLKELNNWRENVIKDKGVTSEFKTSGWQADYPTRTLEEWEHVLELWQPWVYREPGKKVEHPGKEIAKTNLEVVPGY